MRLQLVVLSAALAVGLHGCCEDDHTGHRASPAPTPTPAPMPAPTPSSSGSVGPPGPELTDRDRKPSRYPSGSPLWDVMKLASTYPQTALSSWFVNAPVESSLEGALAIALSRVVGVRVAPEDMKRWFCPGSPRPCSIGEFAREPKGYQGKLERFSQANSPTREAAFTACESGKLPLLEKIREGLQHGGAALLGFVPNAFEDFANKPAGGLHGFSIHSVGQDGSIYLQDSAELSPLVFHVVPEHLCKVLVAPSVVEANLSTPVNKASEWSTYVWFTGAKQDRPLPTAPPTLPEPPPPDTDKPLPPPEPPPPSPPPIVAQEEPPASGDLGVYLFPSSYTTSTQWEMAVTAPPSPYRLQFGVEPAAARSTARWLERVERECGVRRASGDRFFVSASCDGTIWSRIYSGAMAERSALAELAARFGRKRSRWQVEAVVRFVQAMPYELIPERPHGLRPPLEVLARRAGDCDSLSLLGAVLLRMLGWRSAVIALPKKTHAILGITAADLPWVTEDGESRFRDAKGEVYIGTEMTSPNPLGRPAWKSLRDTGTGSIVIYPLPQ